MMNWEETVEVKKEKKQADMGKHATINNNGGVPISIGPYGYSGPSQMEEDGDSFKMQG